MKKTNFYFNVLLGLCFLITCGLGASAQSLVAKGYNFTPSSSSFSYLSGGTSVSSIQTDDAYSSPIPLGFTFTFCGVDYTEVIVCSNGWLVFGNTLPSNAYANWNYNDYVGGYGITPAVYPLYEDLSGSSGNASYLVTGGTGNHVFTMEWKNWLWDYAASSPSVSFQVKLYESTGAIECLYQQESGSVAVGTSYGATIGICNTSTDWQTLSDPGTSPTSSSSSWYGYLTSRPATGQSYMWDPGPTCPGITGYSVTNVNSSSATFTFNSISGTAGYEYVIDNVSTNPTPTATITTTSSNTITKTGLAPSTTYYVHIRNSCGTFNKSKWGLYSFMTLPPCSKPTKFIKSDVDTSSANIQWDPVAAASLFQYVFDQDRTNPPTDPTKYLTTTGNSISKTGLDADVTYYIHVRTICPGKDTSIWVLDSFHTPIPCRPPAMQLSTLKSSQAVIIWNPVRSAVSYEYYFGAPSAPPAFGTPYYSTSILQTFLTPNTEYNMHARSQCSYEGVKSFSPWGTLDFTTLPPLSIDNVQGNMPDVTVYPNPVKTTLSINIAGVVGNNAHITITDLVGKTIRTVDVSSNAISLDMHDLSQGVYLLKYNDGNNNSKVIKVTKE